MRKLSLTLIIIAAVCAVIGGILRLAMVELIAASRVWAGVSAILLLASIALNTLEKEQ